VNTTLISKWRNGCPIHELGLEEILNEIRGKNLFFTTDIRDALDDTDIIYIAVPTPTKQHGEGKGSAYDMSFIESVIRAISSYYNHIVLSKDIIIVEKSTVPILTHKIIKEIIIANQTLP
jgi:UDPglucose 6-dehydrogenase